MFLKKNILFGKIIIQSNVDRNTQKQQINIKIRIIKIIINIIIFKPLKWFKYFCFGQFYT